MRGRSVLGGVALCWLLVGAGLPTAAQGACEPNFPQGNLSFADEVVSLNRGTFGTAGTPGQSLGPPGGGSVTLGNGGTLVIRFTDNVLTGSDSPAPDLYVFEAGPVQEFVTVEVSRNGDDWFSVGQTTGQCGFVDLDAFGYGTGDRFRFVRVMDIFDHEFRDNSSAGAEIDAIGAISTAAAGPGDPPPGPEPGPPPTADDRYTQPLDEPLVIGEADGLTANDAPGTVVVDSTQPELGRVEVNRNGAFVYDPQGGCGTATFRYTGETRDGAQSTSRVEINVRGGCGVDTPGESYAGNGGVATDTADGGAVVVGETGETGETATADPAAVAPAPIVADPVNDESVIVEPVAADPVAGEPAATDPVLAAQPAAPVTADAAAPGPAPMIAGCGDVTAWYDAQLAYEAAGGVAADPALVDALDSDRNGIACDELME